MWYKILRVDSNASKIEIENAYRTLSQDPKIVNDMNKSFELRQAYLEGIKQASNNQPSVNTTHYQSASNIQPNKSNNSSKTAITVLVVIFVIAAIVLGVLFTLVDNISNITGPKVSSFDNEILKCISNGYDDDITVDNDALEKELENAGYKIEEVKHYTYIAHKQLDEYVIIVEVQDTDDPSCGMNVNYEVDISELTEEGHTASLIGRAALGYDFFLYEETDFSLEYHYHTTYPVSSVEEVAFEYYDLEYDKKTGIKFIAFDDNEEKVKEYNEIIPAEQFLEMVEILQAQIEMLK